jgi:DNA polymerase III subunit beta
MRLTAATAPLLEAASLAASVAAAKSPKRILECVALRASRTEGLRLESSDLDVSIALRLSEASVEEDGVVAVPASRLVAVLREVAEGRKELTLVGSEGSLEVEAPGCRFRVHGEDPQELHAPDPFPATSASSIPIDALRRMIERTQFATAREPGRFALHGVQFRFARGELEVVATDGRRLARIVRPAPEGAQTELKVIVGTKPLGLVGRLAPEGSNAAVEVAVADRRIYFRAGNAVLSSRLIDGTFPPYEQVIPPPSAKGFEVNVERFATALRRASLLTTREMRSVTLEIGGKKLVLSSRAPDVGEAKVELDIPYDAPTEKLGFNPDYLLDALKVMDPQRDVRFELTSPRSPGKLTDGAEYVYVVSPVSVTE